MAGNVQMGWKWNAGKPDLVISHGKVESLNPIGHIVAQLEIQVVTWYWV